MRDGMIIVEDLRKSYGKTQAVDGMNLWVEPGEVVGLLGPNGAGKTTTMEILEGLRRPDSGIARVLGRDVRSGLAPIRDRIGVVLQSGSILDRATVGELAHLYALMYQRPIPATTMLERVGLSDKVKSLAGGLSGGQKQRLAMVLALIGDPDLLFLDEPTANLDPQGRALLWDMVRERTVGTGRAALLTTHSIEEAQALCSRVAIMEKGKLLAMDSPSALINQHCPGATVTFETDQDTDDAVFAGIDGFTGIDRAGAERRVSLSGPRLEPMLATLMGRQQQAGFPIGNLSVERYTLADVFLKLTGRDLRDE